MRSVYQKYEKFPTAMQGLGYKEVVEYLNKETTEEEIRKIYDSIKLPKRATIGSAGYDFYSPITFLEFFVAQQLFHQSTQLISFEFLLILCFLSNSLLIPRSF